METYPTPTLAELELWEQGQYQPTPDQLITLIGLQRSLGTLATAV